MMRVANILLVVALGLVVSLSSVAAQDTVTNEEFSVSVTRPAEWVDVEGNDRAVFNFKHEESHSQIEVIGTRLMTEDVAEVFFETFHETLTNSEFLMVGTPSDASYGEYSGTETTYTFTHSGVTLKVAVFQFVSDTIAWLAVAYMQEDAFDTYLPSYREVISSMSFTAEE